MCGQWRTVKREPLRPRKLDGLTERRIHLLESSGLCSQAARRERGRRSRAPLRVPQTVDEGTGCLSSLSAHIASLRAQAPHRAHKLIRGRGTRSLGPPSGCSDTVTGVSFILRKTDPGRAKQKSVATALTNFTKPGAQNKGDLYTGLG